MGLDTLTGFENIIGSDFDAILLGDGNDNTIEGGLGNDLMIGGAGIDTLSYAGAASAVNVNLAIVFTPHDTGGAGMDRIHGFENLTGSDFDDVLAGDLGDNVLFGGAGNDRLNGQAGNDTFLYTAAGVYNDDFLQGGTGFDTISIAGIGVFDFSDPGMDFLNMEAIAFDRTSMGAATLILSIDNINNASELSLTAAITGHLGGADTLQIEMNEANSTAFNGSGYVFTDWDAADSVIINGSLRNEFLIGTSQNDVINGGAGIDTLEGGAGDDVLDGGADIDTVGYVRASAGVTVDLSIVGQQDTLGAGLDTLSNIENLFGSNFNDTLTGDAGNNQIRGDDGDDILVGGLGDDILRGDAGTDTASYASASSAVSVDLGVGGAQQDTLGAGLDTLIFVENLIGSSFNDTLSGNTLDNVLDGGAGIDTLSYAGAGAGVSVDLSNSAQQDTIGAGLDTLSNFENLIGSAFDDILSGSLNDEILDGGAGNDTVSYASAITGVLVDLGNAGAQITVGGGTDTLSGFENLRGSAFNDTLTGDGNANVIEGGSGNDIMVGGGGDDTLSYAAAAAGVTVNLAIAAQQDTLGAGLDTASGFENLRGSAFNDTLIGDGNDNTLTGGAGDDTLDGGVGNDTANYSAASAAITVDLSDLAQQDTFGAGLDTLSNIENLYGSAFNDTLTGDGNDNVLEGGAGDDALDGGAGNDTASYAGASSMVNVQLHELAQQNTVGAGLDTLANIENLIGSDFDDLLGGDGGNNILAGGLGTDIVYYQAATAGVTVDLSITAQQDTVGAGLDTLSGFEHIIGSEFNDIISGTSGNNNMQGRGGTFDTVSYANALAAVTVNLGITIQQDTIGAGLDTLSGFESLIGSDFNDTLTGSAFTDSIEGGAGNDVMDGGAGTSDTAIYSNSTSGVSVDLSITVQQDTLGAGLDTLSNFERLLGSAFADTLIGNAGNNLLAGGDGNDILDGGAGIDTLLGGDGDDTFRYTSPGANDLTIHGGDGTDTVLIAGDGTFDFSNPNFSHFTSIEAITFDRTTTADATLILSVININSPGELATAATITGDTGGVDTIIIAGSGPYTLNISGWLFVDWDANDLILIEGFNFSAIGDNLTGTTQADVIAGFAGNDTLNGHDGNDILRGGDGNDTLIGGVGADELDGGAGFDRASYLTASAGVLIDMSNTALNTGDAAGDTYISIERLHGSNFADTISNTGTLFVFAGDGDDILTGDTGNNVLRGENDNDTLIGGAGVDQLYGDAGNDILGVHVGDIATGDRFDGGTGTDELRLFGTGSDIFDFRMTAVLGIETLYFADDLGGGAQIRLNSNQLTNFNVIAETDIGQTTELAIFMSTGQTIINLSGLTFTGFTEAADRVILSGNAVSETLIGSVINDRILGRDGHDTIEGGLGNDELFGEGGVDTVSYASATIGVTVDLGITSQQDTVGAGLDTITGFERILGSAFNDMLTGDSGNNYITGGAGNDIIDGGAGTDTASYTTALSGVTVNLQVTTQQDTIGAGLDTLTNIESIYGSNFDDTLIADGSATGVFVGLNGNDNLRAFGGSAGFYGGNGDDYIQAFTNFDTVGATFDGGANTDTFGVFASLASSTFNLRDDTISNIEKLKFEITGAQTIVLEMNAAQFTMTDVDIASIAHVGGGGQLSLFMDTLTYFDLSGVSFTGFTQPADFVTVIGDNNNEIIIGSSINDVINGGDGFDTIEGGLGTNTLDGGAHADVVSYAGAASAVTVSLAISVQQDTIGAGLDTLSNFENLRGSRFDDTLTGDDNDNIIWGGAGNDSLIGGDGNDLLLGDDGIVGNDILDGGLGLDTANYGTIASGVHVDLSLTGQQDTIGAGLDTLISIENVTGSQFDDVLLGNSGDNSIIGLGGNDTASYANSTAGVSIDLANTASQNTVGAGTDRLFSIENLTGSAFDDTLSGNAGDNVLDGGVGVDTLSYAGASSAISVDLRNTAQQNTLGAGLDTLSGFENLTGSAFDDTLSGDDGNNVLDGGAGTDTASYASAIAAVTVNLSILIQQDTLGAGLDTLTGFENLIGSAFADTLIGDVNDNVIDGGAGNDILEGGLGNNTLNGGADNDTASYAGAASFVMVDLNIAGAQSTFGAGTDTLNSIENLTGSAFNDILFGDGNANVLNGGAGDDIIDGGGGNDRLIGGLGNDTLYGGAGTDIAD